MEPPADMVTVVDYGAGNLRSVVNALEALGHPSRVTDDPAALRDAPALILPGVGSFGEGMDRLRAHDLVAALTEEVLGRKKPYLGICLGLQFLATEGEEYGRHAGLGWIPGVTRRIEPGDPSVKVPHIGWNTVDTARPGTLLANLGEPPVFYFVHSYYFEPAPDARDAVSGTCDHGVTMAAVVERDNVFGVQFHPEKSQRAGLRVLENFLRLV